MDSILPKYQYIIQENKNFLNDVDVGMKKAQKHEMIQDAGRFGVLSYIPSANTRIS